MFRKVVTGLCRDRRGLVLVAGAIGILTGVEHLLSKKTPPLPRPVELKPEGTPVAAPARQPRIRISQTKSELGYVYWVVREAGGDPSYALFDTWQEAMDEVTRRMTALVSA